MVKDGYKLKEVVEVTGDGRGFGVTLYLGFCSEVYPVFFRVEVIVLLKVMCFKEFLGLKMVCLFSERQAKSV